MNKIPYAGKEHKPIELRAYTGRTMSRISVKIEFRVANEVLEELNRRFLADTASVHFAEFMRKLVNHALKDPTL